MRRIPSGVTDQYIYFVAVDATDLKTRETGLSGFTVRRSRNGGASAAFTTPTVNETDVTNMPGVYELLLDEDMTIDSGDKSQEVCLHITQASMAPVTLVYELYRPDVTAGETLTVASGIGQASVQSIANNALTAAAINADAFTAAKFAADVSAEIADAVWDEDATGHQTQGTFGQAIGDPGADSDSIWALANTNLNATVSSRASQTSLDTLDDLVDTEVTAILNAVDTEVAAIKAVTDLLPDAGALTSLATAAALATVDTVVDAIKVTTDKLDDTLEDDAGTFRFTANALEESPAGGGGATAVEIADEVWDRATAGHATAGTFGLAISDILTDTSTTLQAEIDGVQADTEDIQSRLPAALVSGRIDASVGAMAANVLTAAAAAADFGTEIGTAVWATTVRVLTASTNLGDLDDAILAVLGSPAGASLAADIAAIEAQTDDIGVAGAGLTAVPWNAAWDAEVQSEVADALTAYDPPTKAELDSAVAPLALEATLATAQTSIDDLPTNAELAAALGTADDAVLAQIALVKAKTDNLPTDPADQSLIIAATDSITAAIAALNDIEAADVLGATVEGTLDVAETLRLCLAVLVGKLSGAATTEVTIRDTTDTVDRVVTTVDADGNRSAVTLNPN